MPDVDRYRAAGTLRPRCETVILGHGVALYRFPPEVARRGRLCHPWTPRAIGDQCPRKGPDGRS